MFYGGSTDDGGLTCKALMERVVKEMDEAGLQKPMTEAEMTAYSASLEKAMDEKITSREGIAKVLKDAGNAEKQGNYETALVKCLKYHRLLQQQGIDHDDLDTLEMFHLIGNTHMRRALFNDAMKFFQKELEIGMKLRPDDELSYSRSYIGIANALNMQSKFDEALTYFEKALAIREKYLGPKHILTASACSDIAIVYSEKKEFVDAIEYNKRALDIRLKELGSDHIDVATTYNNIGAVYKEQGEYHKALADYNLALKIRQKHFGNDHVEVAATLNNMAVVYKCLGDYNKALVFYGQALDIRRAKLGASHPKTKAIEENIRRCNATSIRRPSTYEAEKDKTKETVLPTRPPVVMPKMEAEFEKESGGKPGTWQKRFLICEGALITSYRAFGLKKCSEINLQEATLVRSPPGHIYINNLEGRRFRFRSHDSEILNEWKTALEKWLIV